MHDVNLYDDYGSCVPPRVDGRRGRRYAGGDAGEDSGSRVDDDVAGGGVPRGVSTCAMNASNASNEQNSVAWPVKLYEKYTPSGAESPEEVLLFL